MYLLVNNLLTNDIIQKREAHNNCNNIIRTVRKLTFESQHCAKGLCIHSGDFGPFILVYALLNGSILLSL